jgi:sn-glycerol 3-phosphate transport system substrate-binding protein
MKKILAIVLALCMAFSLCAVSASADDVTELTFWHCWSGGNAELLEAMVEAYNASHSDVHITATYQGDYWEAASKAYTAVATGEAPDLLMMGTDHVSIFMKEGDVLANLIPYMDATGYDKEDLVPAFTNTYWGEDGGLYALGFGRSVPVLYVNTDMLDEIGAEIPRTWAEVDEVSQKLIEAGVCEYGVALPYDSQYFQMIIPQFGGSVWNEEKNGLGCVEDGTLVTALQTLQDMVNNKSMYYGPTTDSPSACRALFLDKKCAMYLHSVSNLAKIDSSADFNYQVSFVPEGTRASVNTGGCTITMLESSPNKDKAWDFLQWFLTDDEGAVKIATSIGYLPTTYTMTKSEAVQDLWTRIPGAKVAFDEADQIAEDFRNSNTGDCLNTFMSAMEAVMYDNEDVPTVVAELNDEVNNLLS